jgi:UDP-2,3-diacylglucosamine pyrophosphatase LpxH
MNPAHFRSIWISDTHLGGRDLQSKKLLQFLQATESDYLYLVGDIFDLWKLKRSWFWPSINNQIVAAIMGKAAGGTRVFYLPGNHDELLRSYSGFSFNNITVADQIVHETVNGGRYLVLHGDVFDCVVQKRRWLADLGSILYDLLLVINRWYNSLRRLTGRPYQSISASIKQRIKQAVNHIGNFEETLVREARRKRVDGLICGHIHHAAIRDINGVLYSNAGDWVESCTALVENTNGTIGIVDWRDTPCSPEFVKPKAAFGSLETFKSPFNIKPNANKMPQASK